MLLLTSTSDLVRVVTDGTEPIDVQASWVDLSAGQPIPGRQNTKISTATTTTVVPSPGASVQRSVRGLSVHNDHATTSALVAVVHTDGTNVVKVMECSLDAGYTLRYDGAGFAVFDTAGSRVEGTAPGVWLGTTLLTSASANFTTGPRTRRIRVRGVGGGGGGAGCTSVASAASAGGGGGAGAYVEKVFGVSPNANYAYTCGSAGTGASGASGNNGGNSTFVVGATTLTAPGGSGAPVATALTTLSAYRGGAGGAVATNGDRNDGGRPGDNGVIVVVAGPVGQAGSGGSSPFGAGGDPRSGVGNGNNGSGYGSGGSGGLTGASTTRTGGNGTAGCWIVDEYS